MSYTPVKILTKKVSLTSADILALNSTPFPLVPIPGAGKVIQYIAAYIVYTHVTTAYVNANQLQITINGAIQGIGGASTLTNSANAYANFSDNGSVSTSTSINQPMTLFVPTANPTVGDGTLDIYVTYRIITV